jgi:HAD superfamily phosphoserine phosphatase-like hydrolase
LTDAALADRPTPDRSTFFLFDLDGTLTREELLPRIAEASNLPSLADLTSRTIAGEIPFHESFRRRVEILSAVPVELVADVILSMPVHDKLMAWIAGRRDQVRVVTGNVDRWVQPWLDRHGLTGYASRTEILNGTVRLVPGGILEKASVLAEFAGFRTVMVGDGANDAQIVRDADFGIASQLVHVVPEVLVESADCIVNDEEALCRVLSRL